MIPFVPKKIRTHTDNLAYKIYFVAYKGQHIKKAKLSFKIHHIGGYLPILCKE